MSGGTLKHRLHEMISGGLKGNRAARIFSWLVIILILLSTLALILEMVQAVPTYFETPLFWLEAVTVGVFTLEYLIGLWTADLAYPKDAHPRLRYICSLMAIIEVLAVLPFYLALILHDSELLEVVEAAEILRLLHLLKLGEFFPHRKHRPAGNP
ncbi:MAG: ion transporter [Clostridia bacterium]|nr:ion transporter [Clostridia bacterium]